MTWPLALMPWNHQREGFAFAADKAATMLAAGMGTGKSAISLALLTGWQAVRTLILCPPSVRSVWRREVAKHCPEPMRAVVLDCGTVAERTEQADRALRDGQPTAVVINYEAAWRDPFASWALLQRWHCVILDEAHAIKTDGACCSRFAAYLTPRSERRLCLTGTPLAHSPLDAWGQFRFLDPTIFGDDHAAYLHRYAAPRQLRKRKRLRDSHNAVAAAIAECRMSSRSFSFNAYLSSRRRAACKAAVMRCDGMAVLSSPFVTTSRIRFTQTLRSLSFICWPAVSMPANAAACLKQLSIPEVISSSMP